MGDLTKFVNFAETCLFIRPQEGGRIINFRLNYAQHQLQTRTAGKNRILILKSRNLGATTWGLGLALHEMWAVQYYESVFVGHREKDSGSIFNIANIMEREIPEKYKRRRARLNRREILFTDMNSKLSVTTAGGQGIERGTRLQRAHLTEIARYPGDVHDTMVGITEASPAGVVIAETTARGPTGWFWETWEKHHNLPNPGWECIFLPWWWDVRNQIAMTSTQLKEIDDNGGLGHGDGGTDTTSTELPEGFPPLTEEEAAWAIPNGVPAQFVAWYRRKRREMGAMMLQEYPNTPAEAFRKVGGMLFFEVVPALNNYNLRTAQVDRHNPLHQPPWQSLFNGHVTLHRPPDPTLQYVVGADPCDGSKDGDFAYFSIHERASAKQVAYGRARWKPSEFAEVLAKFATIYNKALIGCERNHRETVRRLQDDLGYKNLYHPQDPLKPSQRDVRAGWVTSMTTRTPMLDELKEAAEGWGTPNNLGEPHRPPITDFVVDPYFYAECLAFEFNGTRYEAAEGFHDDAIDAIAIAVQMRKVPLARARSF